MKRVAVVVEIPGGDECIDRAPDKMYVCQFHIGKACKLFNKVIKDYRKCDLCLGHTNPPLEMK